MPKKPQPPRSIPLTHALPRPLPEALSSPPPELARTDPCRPIPEQLLWAYRLDKKYNKLDEKYKELDKHYQDLDKKYGETHKENKLLHRHNTYLDSKMDASECRVNALDALVNSLRAECEQEQNHIRKLEDQIKALEAAQSRILLVPEASSLFREDIDNVSQVDAGSNVVLSRTQDDAACLQEQCSNISRELVETPQRGDLNAIPTVSTPRLPAGIYDASPYVAPDRPQRAVTLELDVVMKHVPTLRIEKSDRDFIGSEGLIQDERTSSKEVTRSIIALKPPAGHGSPNSPAADAARRQKTQRARATKPVESNTVIPSRVSVPLTTAVTAKSLAKIAPKKRLNSMHPSGLPEANLKKVMTMQDRARARISNRDISTGVDVKQARSQVSVEDVRTVLKALRQRGRPILEYFNEASLIYIKIKALQNIDFAEYEAKLVRSFVDKLDDVRMSTRVYHTMRAINEEKLGHHREINGERVFMITVSFNWEEFQDIFINAGFLPRTTTAEAPEQAEQDIPTQSDEETEYTNALQHLL